MGNIKIFFQNYATNSSHTLSADIKEFFATNVLSVGYYILYIMPQREDLKRTKGLKNTKKGRNCFVFANGPSIKLIDVDKIKKYQKSGFDVICINSYMSSEMAKMLVPDYYVLSDPISFGLPGEIEVAEEVVNTHKAQIDRLNELNIPVFIPAQFHNLNLFKHSYIFNDFENRFTNNINPSKPRGYRTWTSYKALAIACHLGYDSIYICGLDNDYFKMLEVDENNIVYYEDKHYYDKGTKRKLTNDSKGIGDMLWSASLSFKQLYLFKEFDIRNLNKYGLVDAFSKKHDLDVYVDV
ncbi:hypothetical protein [Methanosarcina sp. 2.H.A.1B.4]|uniref:hypothetical protein n=1 Tax=Methanosarcina sp. 2.H.A.1B.4 TaxID=1483600 RepID=UPI00138E0EA7|nr:hypothetical protein [Methanosarcina sp. 2.H.A.1B.4]